MDTEASGASQGAGGSLFSPTLRAKPRRLPGGPRSRAARLGLAPSEAPSAFPFAIEPTNLMKPSQHTPQGLLEKD